MSARAIYTENLTVPTRPVQDWTGALNHLSIVFEGRVPV